MENRTAKHQSPDFAMKEAARMQRMQDGTFWRTAVKVLIIILILVILFT